MKLLLVVYKYLMNEEVTMTTLMLSLCYYHQKSVHNCTKPNRQDFSPFKVDGFSDWYQLKCQELALYLSSF